MTINILGTDYEYKQLARNDDPMLDDADGYCNPHARLIVVTDEDGYRREPFDTDETMNAVTSAVKRHEIVHAFFAESGLREYCENEQLVDWIAWQLPAMVKTMRSVGAL